MSKDQQLRLITLLQFFSNVAITGSIFLLVISLEAAGTPTVIIGSLSGALGGAGIIGAMLVPWITRKLSFNAVLISSSVVVAVTISMASVLSGTYAMAIPLALSVLLAPSAGAVVFARIAVHVDSERLGRVLSVQKLSGIGGSAASKPLTGYAFGAFGQWGSTLLVGSALIAVTISFYIHRVTQGGSS
ncbi:hypothetical protein [Acaricomes phytoseiuli]|uniref:hypothetical protein n=1 Tax=Acaricomes phytoseiuli TaxID=291968 RepID=UPI0012EAEB1C